jgi:UDP-glucose 4-epimerase
MPRVLITGGAGFIGSHIAEELLSKHEVVVLDDLSGGFIENVPKGAEFVKGNIQNPEFINLLFEYWKFDYVFHLAAYAAECISHYIKHFNYMNNLIGSVNLINASVNNKVKCFVFTSSAAVYGKDKVPNPEDSYGIAKYAVEQELRITREMFGLDYIIFRPHNVYGERQNIHDKYRNVVGIFMKNILEGKPMPIYGDGNQKRAFTYIKDVAPIIAKSIDTPKMYGRTYNIGSDKLYAINELAEHVAKAMGVEARVKHIPARKEVKIVSPTNDFKAKYGLEEGLKIMAEWIGVNYA